MVKVHGLQEKIFEPFGQIIRLPECKADTEGPIHEYWDGLATFFGKTGVNYLVTKPRPLRIQELERHVNTPEMLVLLKGSSLLAVAPAGDLDTAKVRAFQMNPGDAVVLHAGTWHWPPFPQGGNADFIVIYKDGTPQDDLEVVSLPAAEDIEVN